MAVPQGNAVVVAGVAVLLLRRSSFPDSYSPPLASTSVPAILSTPIPAGRAEQLQQEGRE